MNYTDAGAEARRHAPSTNPLIENAISGRPMLIKINGHGFVPKAENIDMVAYSTNRNANQQLNAIANPQPALWAFIRPINHASA